MKGRRPPGFGSTLSTLFRAALDQLGTVREVVDRGTSAQRSWFDATVLQRKRRDALALLGEAVYRAAVAGQLDYLSEDPQLRRLVDDIDDLDQRIDQAAARAEEAGPSSPFSEGVRAAPQRPRSAGNREPRVWRPEASWNAPSEPAPERASDPNRTSEPGPRHRRPSRTGEVDPVADGASRPRQLSDLLNPDSYPDDYDPLDGDRPPAPAPAPAPAPSPPRKRGGPRSYAIEGDDAVSAFAGDATRPGWAGKLHRQFDEGDDDLSEYMHEDDVPDESTGERGTEPEGIGSSTAPAPAATAATAAKKTHAERKPRRSRAAAAKKAKQAASDDG